MTFLIFDLQIKVCIKYDINLKNFNALNFDYLLQALLLLLFLLSQFFKLNQKQGFIKSFKSMLIFATKIIICNLSLAIILFSLFQRSFSFAFKQVLTQVAIKTINTQSTYTFTYDRANTNFGGFTPWNTELVNTTDTIRIIFPSDYPFTGTQDCTSFAQVTVNSQSIDSFTCTRNVRTYTITNAFASLTNLAVSDVVLVILSVLNPSPAVATGQFIGYIGNDNAAGNGGSVQLQPGRFTSAVINFDPTTVNTVGTMILEITPRNSIPLTGSIVISLPSTRTWTYDITATQLPLSTTMSCLKYSANVQASVNCTGDFTIFSIVATDLFSASISTLFSFGVNSFISPPTTQEVDRITITSYFGNYRSDSLTPKIDTIQASISELTAKNLQKLAIYPISSAGANISMQVNSVVGLMFNMTLSDIINQNDAFQITFPSTLSFSIAGNVGGTAGILFNAPTRSGQVLSITQKANPKNYTANSVFVISFFNFTAPPSIQQSDAIVIKIKRGSYEKMVGSGTVQAAFAPLTATLSPVIRTVSAVTSYTINVTISHPLLSSGMVKIYFPNQIDVSAVPSSCATLLGTSVSFTPSCSLISAQRSVTLTQLNSSTSNIPSGQILQFTVTNIKNAPTTATTGGFIVETYYTSDTATLVARGSIQGLNMTAGTIISSKVAVVPSSYICLTTLVTYTITFQSTYALPTNGYVQLLIPRRIGMNIGSVGSKCEFTVNAGTFTSTTCVGDNSSVTHYKVKFSGLAQTQIAANSNISLKITNIFTNPESTAIVSSFGISTFASDGSAISSLLTGITVQMTTPASFITFDVQRLQNINSGPAQYEITLSQKAQLQINAIYQIQFPSEVSLGSSPVCTGLFSSTISCTATSNTLTVTLQSAVTSLSQFGVKVGGVINPPSFKPLSNAFLAVSKTSDGISKYSQQSKVFTLSNSKQSDFTNIESTFTPRIYGSAVFLTIKVTPSVKIVPSKIVVSFPPSTFTISGALGCSSLSISGQCDDNQTSTHSIQVTGTLTASEMIFTITGLVSPTSVSSEFVTVTSFDSLGFKIDKSDNYIKFSVLCTLPCRTCTTGVPTECLSCYSQPISDKIYLYQTNKQCLSSCPAGNYQDKTAFKCLTCDSICEECSNLAENCTTCDQATAFKYLNISGTQQTCLSGCSTGYYPDTTQTPTTCVICQNPCVTCTSRTVCLSCNSTTFFNGSECVLTCPSNTSIPNTVARRCDPCDTVCATCNVTVDNCTSCGANSAFHNGSCVNVCPAGLVVNNGACSTCDSVCLTCSITYKNCTSCDIDSANNKYLLNNTCIAACEPLYYADNLTASCKLCSTLTINCNNCSSSTTCLSCNDPYVLLGTTCLSTTPVGYVNITNVAMPCTGDCATCIGTQSNCTSCKTLNYYQNQCIATCPNFTAPQFKRCQPCNFPCQTCLNQRGNCTSCLSNQSPQYYLNSNDCERTCPDYTYGDNLTNKCEPCVSPCSTCTSSQNCLSCVISTEKFLQGVRCVDTCNVGSLGVNGLCTSCLANCSQCTDTTSKCTKCIANHFLVTSTSTCVSTCPTGLYPNTQSGQCTGCTAPCNTCVNTSTTCLTCLSGIFFNNSCVQACPDKYYELNDVCQPCPSECRTCQSASHCNSCVFTYYLYLGIFCVNPCPATYPVIANNGSCIQCTDPQCTACNASDYCSSCNFPYFLHFGKCVDKCPTNYTANSTACFYDPVVINQTNQTTVNQTLDQSLTTPNMFPVPFTIAASFLGVACLMSKFQYAPTFIAGSLYAIFSLIQWAALVFAFFLTFLRYASITFTKQYLQEIYPFYILLICMGIHYTLNIFALIIQNCILRYNGNFQRWSSLGSTKAFYVICSIVGLLVSHKFKNVMFCKLFNFNIFKAQLDSVQQFRVFNVFSFLGFAPAAGNIVAIVILMMWNPNVNTQLFMAYIDALAMVVLCIILAIFSTCKDDQFFEQKTADGHIFHRRIQQSDQIMKEAIMPPTIFDEEFHGYGRLQSGTELKMRLTKNPFSQTDSVNSQDFVKNVSIQVNEIIERQFDQSKISHLQEVSSVPDVSLFSKHEKSIQYQKKSQHDISLQNAPNYNDEGMQMTQDIKNASVQYSAKPIFENVSQDFISDISHSDEQESNINNQATRPVKKERGLRAQIELDIDQKLKRRQEQLKNLQQQNRKQERQNRTKKFQKQSSSKLAQRQAQKQETPIQSGINRQKINNYFNNDESIGQQSSQLDSQGDIMANLRNGSKHNRLNSERSEQQILALLEKGKKSRQKDMHVDLGNRNEQSNHSLSFNVTRDLDPANHSRDSNLQEGQVIYSNKSKRLNQPKDKKADKISEQRTNQREGTSQDQNRKVRVIYQEEDKSRKSDDDIDDGQQGINQVNVIRGDSNEYLPENFDKSRSTNNISISKQMARRNRNNPLLQNSVMQDSRADQYQEIINNPIDPRYHRGALPQSRYQGDQLDFDTRTNVTKFLGRKSNNPVSAQFSSQNIYENDFNLQSRQMPLQTKSKERSFHNARGNEEYSSFNVNPRSAQTYRMNSKQIIKGNKDIKDLSFHDEDKIQVTQENYGPKEQQLPYSQQRSIRQMYQNDAVSREIARGALNHEVQIPRLRTAKSQKKFKSNQKAMHRQLLNSKSKKDFQQINQVTKYLQKQQKKAQNSKKRLQQIQYMLEREPPIKRQNKTYMKDTYTSQEKRKSLQKVYLNRLKKN